MPQQASPTPAIPQLASARIALQEKLTRNTHFPLDATVANASSHLRALATTASPNQDVHSEEFAEFLDAIDPLSPLRDLFETPENVLYFCGNSLGCQPKTVRGYMLEELDVWASKAVVGHSHHDHDRPWAHMEPCVTKSLARIVGAHHASEVGVMNALSVNLHLLLNFFYRPTSKRYKILLEEHAFPSDHYIVESQLRTRGFDPKKGMVFVKDSSTVLEVMAQRKEELALVLLPGVHYYTGELYPMEDISRMAREAGIVAGYDLAHAIGNVELRLSDWDVDFAAWCSYKYLNGGPGAVGGIFVNHRHTNHPTEGLEHRLVGWWSHEFKTRFDMDNHLKLADGAQSFALSNLSVFGTIPLLASLEIFDLIPDLRYLYAKSAMLTTYLKMLLSPALKLITPAPNHGSQISLFIAQDRVDEVFKAMEDNAVVCDKRRPNVVRVAPAALYTRFVDVWRVARVINSVLEK